MPPIMERQNDKRLLDLLRANEVVHSRARRLDGLRFGVAALIAFGGLLTTCWPALAPTVSVLGTLWAALHTLGLAAWGSRELRRAAVLQEMFDTQLFVMRWNPALAGPTLPVHEVNHLARRFRIPDTRLRDYYEIPDIPPPFDVLACQQQNLAWGSRVHRRYAYSSLSVAAALAAAGPVLALANGLTVSQMVLQWYVPSLGLLLLTVDNWRNHLWVSRERERVLELMTAWIEEALNDPAQRHDLPLAARDVQDLLLLTRLRVARVPNLFFLRFHSDDREDFRATLDDLLTRIAPRNSP